MKKTLKFSSEFFYKIAVRTGLEPATPGVTGLYSNQLNYRTILLHQTIAIVLNCECKCRRIFLYLQMFYAKKYHFLKEKYSE